MTDLVFLRETGARSADGRVRWFEFHRDRHTGEDRTRILRRDAEFPTDPDGWKYVPRGLATEDGRLIVDRYRWEDARAYAGVHL